MPTVDREMLADVGLVDWCEYNGVFVERFGGLVRRGTEKAQFSVSVLIRKDREEVVKKAVEEFDPQGGFELVFRQHKHYPLSKTSKNYVAAIVTSPQVREINKDMVIKTLENILRAKETIAAKGF